MQITLFYESDDGKVLEIGYDGDHRDVYEENMDYHCELKAVRALESCLAEFKKDLMKYEP